MSHPAIDLIENGSYQKASELMLRDIYQEKYTNLQIDYWTSKIKRYMNKQKKTNTDFATMPKTTAEKVYFAIRERMNPQTEQYRNLHT